MFALTPAIHADGRWESERVSRMLLKDLMLQSTIVIIIITITQNVFTHRDAHTRMAQTPTRERSKRITIQLN